ncbi:hypothetical protein THAOC_34761 [Thalassiosira oceanica]|uniref:Uncharacterized protein n=1 Tax=Thalassiosira oceanica TaxID=159749 RepID=K0RIQ6_THAOC|nr:hypothetical protein THAOC_34761 [Thalassiosira oceanica]|eukprot:EJK46567.1 hypothetical protein THAOC_34761 [Thalassiosira oceanica]
MAHSEKKLHRWGSNDSPDSGGWLECLRIFRTTSHWGDFILASLLARHAATHHQADSRRESTQSSPFRRPPEAAGGSA